MTTSIDNDSNPHQFNLSKVWITLYKWIPKKKTVDDILNPSSNLARAESKTSKWFLFSMILAALLALCIVGAIILFLRLPAMLNRVQYILAPGVAALEVVRPGEMPMSYAEMGLSTVVSLANGWTYETLEDNFNILYKHFYSKELSDRTKANLKAMKYVEEAKEKQLVSLWKYLPDESDFRWCGEVSIMKTQKGVACGIVTGEQRLFYAHNEPLATRKLSYLIFAVNVAPNPTTPGRNFFALEVVRAKRGDRLTLQKELEDAFKNGTLPSDDEENYVRP